MTYAKFAFAELPHILADEMYRIAIARGIVHDSGAQALIVYDSLGPDQGILTFIDNVAFGIDFLSFRVYDYQIGQKIAIAYTHSNTAPEFE